MSATEENVDGPKKTSAQKRGRKAEVEKDLVETTTKRDRRFFTPADKFNNEDAKYVLEHEE